jgi:hypothetical protein
MSVSAAGTSGQVIAIALTLGVHVLGALALIYLLVRDSGTSPRDWWPGDDDGPPRDDGGPPPGPRDGGGGLPLPDAAPAPVRLREPAHLADAYDRPRRRPAHPARDPERTPAQR